MISSVATVASNILASNIKSVSVNTSSISTLYIRASTVITNTVYQSSVTVSSIFANTVTTTNFQLKTLLGSSIKINNLSSYSTTIKQLLADSLDVYSLSSPIIYSIDMQTSSISTVYSIVNQDTNFVDNYTSSITVQNVIAVQQATENLQTNIALFANNPIGSLYFSSGFFYANSQKFITLDNTNINIISTTQDLIVKNFGFKNCRNCKNIIQC